MNKNNSKVTEREPKDVAPFEREITGVFKTYYTKALLGPE